MCLPLSPSPLRELLLPLVRQSAVVRHDLLRALLSQLLREAVQDQPLQVDDSFVEVTLSLGVALHNPQCGQSHDAAVKEADQALYRAKEKGRNCASS